jgi:hypothetical protein
MAIRDYRDNSSGDYRTPTHTDCSSMCDGLEAGASMSAGNTSNNPPGTGAPGSEPVNPAPALSEQDRPGLDTGSPQSYVRRP